MNELTQEDQKSVWATWRKAVKQLRKFTKLANSINFHIETVGTQETLLKACGIKRMVTHENV